VVVPWMRAQRLVQLANELADFGVVSPARAKLPPQCAKRRCTAIGLDTTKAADGEPPYVARLIEVTMQGMGER
jgi:hypothetical protein